MRTKTVKLFILSIASVALITSCNHGGGSFQTDSKTGVVYRFIKHDESGKTTDSGYAKVILSYFGKGKDGKDTMLFDSHKRGSDSTGNLTIQLKKTFNGCLEQGLMMMAVGDSAEFQINADSLYLKTFHFPPDKLPAGITGTTIYTFHIKLTKFLTKKDIMDEQRMANQKYMEKMMLRKAMEPSSIAEYLKKNHYENIQPDQDSIFYLHRENGSGKQIKEGDSLEIAYRGMLLNDTIFDQSGKGPDHANLVFMYSAKASLIPGWIKVLGTLHQGDNVKVLLPSAMGYGPRQAGPKILPYSPLVFDIKVVNVKSN